MGVLDEVQAMSDRQLQQLRATVSELERRAENQQKVVAEYEAKARKLERELEDKGKQVTALAKTLNEAEASLKAKEVASLKKIAEAEAKAQSVVDTIEEAKASHAQAQSASQTAHGKVVESVERATTTLKAVQADLVSRLDRAVSELTKLV